MSQVAVADEATRLDELIAESRTGKEIILTKDDLPVAKIVGIPIERRRPRRGNGMDFIAHIPADFDDIPGGFEEYIT